MYHKACFVLYSELSYLHFIYSVLVNSAFLSCALSVCLAAPRSRVTIAKIAVCNPSLCYSSGCFRNWLGFMREIESKRERMREGGRRKNFLKSTLPLADDNIFLRLQILHFSFGIFEDHYEGWSIQGCSQGDYG